MLYKTEEYNKVKLICFFQLTM